MVESAGEVGAFPIISDVHIAKPEFQVHGVGHHIGDIIIIGNLLSQNLDGESVVIQQADAAYEGGFTIIIRLAAHIGEVTCIGDAQVGGKLGSGEQEGGNKVLGRDGFAVVIH